jgi:heme/copper-type cytochrome/quinol oxidase subunit 2
LTKISLQKNNERGPKMHKNTFNLSKWLLPIFLIVLVLSACSPDVTEEISAGPSAPDFSLQNALGGTVSLQDYVGEQPVLLYFHMAVG